jgi:hypothetical protein
MVMNENRQWNTNHWGKKTLDTRVGNAPRGFKRDEVKSKDIFERR